MPPCAPASTGRCTRGRRSHPPRKSACKPGACRHGDDNHPAGKCAPQWQAQPHHRQHTHRLPQAQRGGDAEAQQQKRRKSSHRSSRRRKQPPLAVVVNLKQMPSLLDPRLGMEKLRVRNPLLGLGTTRPGLSCAPPSSRSVSTRTVLC